MKVQKNKYEKQQGTSVMRRESKRGTSRMKEVTAEKRVVFLPTTEVYFPNNMQSVHFTIYIFITSYSLTIIFHIILQNKTMIEQ